MGKIIELEAGRDALAEVTVTAKGDIVAGDKTESADARTKRRRLVSLDGGIKAAAQIATAAIKFVRARFGL